MDASLTACHEHRATERRAAPCVQTNPGLQKLVMGAVGLPFGLIMVMICGAELFTGNTMIMGCAFYEGRITLPQLLRSWVVSFLSAHLLLDDAMRTVLICPS